MSPSFYDLYLLSQYNIYAVCGMWVQFILIIYMLEELNSKYLITEARSKILGLLHQLITFEFILNFILNLM